MDRHILMNRGFSLVELSIVMGIIAILSAAVIPMAIRSIELKAGEKTIVEVGLIQEAAKKFYFDRKSWPTDPIQMQAQGYLSPLWSLKNPWNNPYQTNSTVKTFDVSTVVPSNIVDMLAFRLPASSVNGAMVTSSIGIGASDAIAPGVIVAWSGLIMDIPQGWALCDGTNGTPDLRDRFIVGASQDNAGVAKTNITGTLTQTGGRISHDHGRSTGEHALTIAEMPSHQHSSWGEAFPQEAPWGVGAGGRGHLGASNSDRDNYYYLTSPMGGGQGHSHSINADNHLPPYYALAFIMKLS